MSNVIFSFQGNETKIQCQREDKFKDISKRFTTKAKINMNKIYYVYDGNVINEELNLEQIANEEDKKRDIIYIVVGEKENNSEINKNNIINTTNIICPICKENTLININDYRINLFDCKNGHKMNNVCLIDFKNTQKIDISKIICDICKINNKGNIFNNEIYKCLTCGKNICPLCNINHDNSHRMIKYELKDNICNTHYNFFTKYCNKCKKNLCMKCEKEHKEHETIYLGDLLPNDNIIGELNEFKEKKDKFNNYIKEIMNKLKDIIESIDIYYNIMNNIVNNNTENKNYQQLQNINEFMNYKSNILKDMEEIMEDNKENKFDDLMNIYNKIKLNRNKINCNNYIIAEIEIKEKDINKDVLIINSFEHYRKKLKNEVKIKIEDMNKWGNEEEIKENCKIEINNEIIPFTHFYKFNEAGKHTIKYMFINNLTKTNHMFFECNSLTNINLSNFNTQDVTNMAYMFNGCSSLTNINTSNFNTQQVTNMEYMFNGCSSLTKLNLSNFKVENVINMSHMFSGCGSLSNINLSNFNTQNVINMESMFNKCSSLVNLNLSNLDTQNVKYMNYMFNNCSSLKDINLSNFNTQNVVNMYSMFDGCSSLSNLNLSNFNTGNITNMGYMFNGCSSLTNIDISNFITQNCTNISHIFDKCISLKKENVITKDIKILKKIRFK